MFSSEPVVIKDAILHSETTKHIRLYELQTHRTEVLYDAYKPEGNYIESFIDEYQKGLSSEPSAFELVSMKHTKHYDEKGDMFEIKAQLELDLKLGNTVFFNVYVNIYFYYKVTEVFDATVDYRSNVTIDDTHFFIVRRNRLLEEINQLTFSDRLKHIDHTYFSHQLLLNVKHDFKKKWLDYLHKSGFKQFFYQEIDDITEFCAFRLRASLKNIERYQFDVDLLSNEDISILYEAISECSENGLYINFNVLKEAVSESVVEHTAFSKKTLDNIENKDNQVVIDLPELMSSNEFKYEAILHTCYVNVCVFTIDLKTKKKRNLAIVRFSLSEK